MTFTNIVFSRRIRHCCGCIHAYKLFCFNVPSNAYIIIVLDMNSMLIPVNLDITDRSVSNLLITLIDMYVYNVN